MTEYLGVSMPIFSIHGNHDDPGGDQLATLDILSAAGYINYFGRQLEPDDIEIVPILLKKGDIKIGLFGLGNMRDERLHRAFLSKKVKFLHPLQEPESYYNIFVIHQNRVKHGATGYIPESFLDKNLDLVVWGHEHECLIDLCKNEETGFQITQPGSSIATSLCEGESREKHVAILDVLDSCEKKIQLRKIPLKTVRPFVLDECILSKIPKVNRMDEQGVIKFLGQKVDSLIEKANNQWIEANPESDKETPLPIVRLRVDYTGYNTVNPVRFGQKFLGKVANIKDVLQFFRKRNADKGTNAATSGTGSSIIPTDQIPLDGLNKVQMDDLIRDFLQKCNLHVLTADGMIDLVKQFVEKDEKDTVKKKLMDITAEKKKGTSKNILSESELESILAKEFNIPDEAEPKAKAKAQLRAKKGAPKKEDEMEVIEIDDALKKPRAQRKRKTAEEEAEKGKVEPARKSTRITRKAAASSSKKIDTYFQRTKEEDEEMDEDEEDDSFASYSKRNA
ncbi:Double-strand break repair protein mre11a [Phlyctochytrium planicorne]|nr:Double-strand break repair protein mre11a [Phlyctochytrium planicorne]